MKQNSATKHLKFFQKVMNIAVIYAKGLSHDKIIDLLCCQQSLTKQGQHLSYIAKNTVNGT